MLKNRLFLVIAGLLFAAILAVSAEPKNATITGEVIDGNTGKPLYNVTVEIIDIENRNVPVAVVLTDLNGIYTASVPGGKNYEIWVRVGDVNPKQTVYAESGHVYPVRFEISKQVGQKSTSITEDPSVFIVVIVALLILLLIAIDQVFMRRKRIIKDLESKQAKLMKEIEDKEKVKSGSDELVKLKKREVQD